LAAEFLVVNFKVGHRAAGLASPAIAAQYLIAELFVQAGIEPQLVPLWWDVIHDAFSVK
jgi:hypothetical protein